MSNVKYLPIVSLALAAAWGCSSAQKTSTAANNAGAYSSGSGADNSTAAASPASGGTPTADASGNTGAPAEAATLAASTTTTDGTDETAGGETTSTMTKTGAAAATPASWCANAALTTIAKSASHAQGFAALCNNGQPTALFTSLVASPYTGGATPAITMISPVADANGQVSAFFGVAQKLPITSAVQWTKVGPEQGVAANEESLMKAQGQTPKSCTVTPEASNTDKFWSRGWTLADNSTQTVLVVTVNTIYNYKADQYDFGDGSYMYTATFVPPAVSGGTLENYQLLTAGLDLNGTGYLVTVGNLAADDHGIPSEAETAVTATIDNTIKWIYGNAVAAK